MTASKKAISKTPAELIEIAFNETSDFATTLAKGLALLDCFTVQHLVLSNAELATATGLKRPTVARLTYTLEELGYLVRASGGFRLGRKILTVAHPLLSSFTVRQLARPLMQELASDVRGTVSIGVLDGCNLIYVETARSGDGASHLPDIGSTLPLLGTALGRALIAMLPDAERAALETRMAREYPDLWKDRRAALSEDIRSCHRRGFSVSHGDWVQDIFAVGTPLFHDPNLGYLAINCGVPAFRLRAHELEDEIGPRLTKLTATIRALCGHNSQLQQVATLRPRPQRARPGGRTA